MALRKIREIGDPILNKTCKEVKEITDRTKDLIDDMFETMYEAQGVGLAAPQVGILKRIVVIDCGDDPLLLINPEVLETSGEQTGQEGCLSVPGKARALLHEIDHLDGHLYVERVEGDLMDVVPDDEDEMEEEE